MNESPTLTELTPVIMENEYGEMTEAKVPYTNQSNTGSNKEDLHTDTGTDADDDLVAQTVYCKLVILYRGLPKEMFVSRVLLNEASCEVTLENYRSNLFEEIKETDDFPYGLQCELKRRVHTRSGDTVAVKLAYDIHTLMSVIEGGDYGDMRDMIRAGRSQRTQSSSGAGNTTLMPCEYSAEIKSLMQNMTSLKAEVLNLKQKYVAIETARSTEIQTMKSTILILKSDISLLSSTVSRAVTEIRLAAERIESEKSLGVVNLKSEIRTMKQNMKAMQDTVDTIEGTYSPGRLSTSSRYTHGNRKSKHTQSKNGSSVNDHVQVLEGQKSRAFEQASTGTNLLSGTYSTETFADYSNHNTNDDQNEVIVVPISEPNVPFDAGTLENSSNQNTSWSNAEDNYTENSESEIPNQIALPGRVEGAGADTSGFSSDMLSNLNRHVVTDMVTPPSRTDVAHEAEQPLQAQTALYSEIAAANANMPLSQACSEPNTMSVTSPVYTRRPSFVAFHLPGALRASPTTVQTQSDYTAVLPNSTTYGETSQRIPVHVGKWPTPSVTADFRETAALETENIEDEEFSKFVKKKPRRYYLGGFKPGISRKLIEQYVRKRGPTVTWVRIWRSKRNANSLVIRLNVEDNQYAEFLEHSTFWPRGVICRPWINRNELNSDKSDDYYQQRTRYTYGRSDVDDYNPYSPLRDASNLD